MASANYLLDNVSQGHSDDIWCLKYTPFGALTGSADGTLKLWSPSNTDEIVCTMTSNLHKPGKKSLAIVGLDVQQNVASPEYAISCTLDSIVSRFSLKSETLGQEEATWTPSPPEGSQPKKITPGQAWCISVHPDPSAERFAVSGLGGQLRVLSSDIATFGEEKLAISIKGSFSICKYSPNGKILACANNDGQVSLYDSGTGQLLQFWTAHVGNIRAVAFSPDSSLIITGGDDKQINVFDIKGLAQDRDTSTQQNGTSSMRSRYSTAGQHVANIQGHTGWILGLACRSDGRLFASSSSDGTIKLWDLARPSSACLGTLREHESDVWAIDWAEMPPSASVDGVSSTSLGGGKLISGGKDGILRWWRGTG